MKVLLERKDAMEKVSIGQKIFLEEILSKNVVKNEKVRVIMEKVLVNLGHGEDGLFKNEKVRVK